MKNNSEQPKVYIILPSYNGEKFLLEQLMSIYYQNYTNWYLIFINDWSTDSSENIIRNWISNYNLHNKVKIIIKENWWVNSAVQRWLEEVKKICDKQNIDCLISYCDQDDIWTREKLALQVKYMISHPECDLSFHDLSIVDENWILTTASELEKKYLKDFSFLYFSIVGNLLTSAWIMYKAKRINEILPMPIWPCLYQDERVTYVLSLRKAKIGVINKSLVYHRIWHQSLLKTTWQKYKKDYFKYKLKQFNILQEKFPQDNILKYVINYKTDRFINWENYWVIQKILLLMIKYPKAFLLLTNNLLHNLIIKATKKQ